MREQTPLQRLVQNWKEARGMQADEKRELGLCKNCGLDTHPAYLDRYNGYCLECANAGVAEKDEQIKKLTEERDDAILSWAAQWARISELEWYFKRANAAKRKMRRDLEISNETLTASVHETEITRVALSYYEDELDRAVKERDAAEAELKARDTAQVKQVRNG